MSENRTETEPTEPDWRNLDPVSLMGAYVMYRKHAENLDCYLRYAEAAGLTPCEKGAIIMERDTATRLMTAVEKLQDYCDRSHKEAPPLQANPLPIPEAPPAPLPGT